MGVVWRRAAHCREGNSACGAAILASILAGVIGLAAPWSTPAHGAEQCLATPGSKTPPGGHWYYTTDRETKRKCWFLGRAGEKGRRAAAKRSRAVRVAAREPIPLPLPRAMARDVAPDTPVAPHTPDESPPGSQVEAKAVPQSEPVMHPSGGEPVSTTGEGADDAWRTSVLNEPSQVWPVLTPPEPAAAKHPPLSNSEPQQTDERTADAHLKTTFAGEPPLARAVVDSETPAASRNTPGELDLLAMLLLALCIGGALFAVPVLRRLAGASKKDPDQTAEYVSTLSRFVAGLDPDDAEAHRAAYDRARRMLIVGLQRLDPPLPKATIAVERSAFEAAVRRIEAKRRRPVPVLLRLMKRAWLRTGLDNVRARLGAWAGKGGGRLAATLRGMSFSRHRA